MMSGNVGKKEKYNWHKENSELVSLINSGKVKEALVFGQEMVEYVDKKYKKDSKEKATTYNNMGMVFMLAGDYFLAEKCFHEALAMRKRLFGEKDNEVAVIFLNMVQLYKLQAQEIMMVNKVETN